MLEGFEPGLWSTRGTHYPKGVSPGAAFQAVVLLEQQHHPISTTQSACGFDVPRGCCVSPPIRGLIDCRVQTGLQPAALQHLLSRERAGLQCEVRDGAARLGPVAGQLAVPPVPCGSAARCQHQ